MVQECLLKEQELVDKQEQLNVSCSDTLCHCVVKVYNYFEIVLWHVLVHVCIHVHVNCTCSCPFNLHVHVLQATRSKSACTVCFLSFYVGKVATHVYSSPPVQTFFIQCVLF